MQFIVHKNKPLLTGQQLEYKRKGQIKVKKARKLVHRLSKEIFPHFHDFKYFFPLDNKMNVCRPFPKNDNKIRKPANAELEAFTMFILF